MRIYFYGWGMRLARGRRSNTNVPPYTLYLIYFSEKGAGKPPELLTSIEPAS
jgi:hypothetical protein